MNRPTALKVNDLFIEDIEQVFETQKLQDLFNFYIQFHSTSVAHYSNAVNFCLMFDAKLKESGFEEYLIDKYSGLFDHNELSHLNAYLSRLIGAASRKNVSEGMFLKKLLIEFETEKLALSKNHAS